MTEAEHAAATAWKLMTRKGSILDTLTGESAMPPEVAVDYVQDVTGDRNAAILLLCQEAAREMGELPQGRTNYVLAVYRKHCQEYVATGQTWMARSEITYAQRYMGPFPSPPNMSMYHDNDLWCKAAKEIIDHVSCLVRHFTHPMPPIHQNRPEEK